MIVTFTDRWVSETMQNWLTSAPVPDVDGIIDFDIALRDPADPMALRTDFENTAKDHIHPNDAGNEALANAVNLDPLLD